MGRFVPLAKKGDIPEGQTRAFNVEGKDIAISCVNGKYYAFINVCSHMEFPLADGNLTGTVIECAHHGATFDITTGRALSMPAVTPIEIFEVKIDGDEIKVNLGR